MGLLSFKILFDREGKEFYPDDWIKGEVIVSLDSPEEACGVRIRIQGKARVEWTQPMMPKITVPITSINQIIPYPKSDICEEDSQDEVFSGEEHYLAMEKWLLGNEGGQVLPSSFEGSHGYVRYMSTASIVRPSNQSDSHVMHPFRVEAIVKHSYYLQSAGFVDRENAKEFGICCWKTKAVSMKFRINRSGYVPGDSICINGTVQNDTRRPIKKVKARFKQCVRYKALNGVKLEEKTLVRIHRGMVPAKCQQVWNDVLLDVPVVPPSHLGIHQSIVKVAYELEIDATPPGAGYHLMVTFPLIIGNFD